MLDKEKLKQKFILAFTAEQETVEDPTAAIERICEALANAIVEEILQLEISYSSGLIAGSIAVTGKFINKLS